MVPFICMPPFVPAIPLPINTPAPIGDEIGLLAVTLNPAGGVVVPIPTKPAVETNSDDVPTAVFVPEKYAVWPVVPVTDAPDERHVPFTAKQPVAMLMPFAAVVEPV